MALLRKRDRAPDPDPDLSEGEVSSLTRDYYIGNAPKRTKRSETVVMRAVKQRYEAASPPPTSEHDDD
jgi:hypothetical protein